MMSAKDIAKRLSISRCTDIISGPRIKRDGIKNAARMGDDLDVDEDVARERKTRPIVSTMSSVMKRVNLRLWYFRI